MSLLFTTYIHYQGYDIGDLATDFKLENIDGKFVSLSDFKDAKGFIVVLPVILVLMPFCTKTVSRHSTKNMLFKAIL